MVFRNIPIMPTLILVELKDEIWRCETLGCPHAAEVAVSDFFSSLSGFVCDFFLNSLLVKKIVLIFAYVFSVSWCKVSKILA